MLSNTDTFREAAMAFNEFGRYTNHPVNSHSKSQYMIFWDEQKRRCLEGYHIGSDYIPGYYYFYLNFCPIYKLVYDEEEIKIKDKVTATRIFDFPSVWDGDYKFFNYIDEAEKCGKHALAVKCRGRGFSFKGGALGCRNYFLIPGSKSFYAASDKQFLISDGILNKAWDMMDFIDTNTPWAKRRQFKNTLFHRRASYEKIDGNKKIESGYKSEIMGISIKGDPDRIRGKRGKLLVIEEGGNLKELKRLWNISRSSMESGKTTFGLIISFGTGGEDFADLEGLEDLFYYPDAYNIYSVDNIWDKSADGNKCAFYFPNYMNYEGCYDKDGNSDVISAKNIEEKNRDELSKASKSKTTLTQYIAENSWTPQESFLQQTATKFCVLELREQLADIEVNHSKYRDRNWVGSLIVSNTGKIEWKLDPNVSPIDDYPIKNDNKDGCWVIYEQPQLIDGKIPFGFYIAGADPYEQDDSQGDSVGSTFVMNTLTDRIVAEYTGRPKTAYEYYENVRKGLMYYNAICNYENDVRGMYDYFYNNNCLYLLCETPSILIDRSVISHEVAQRKYGTPSTEGVKKWGLELIKQWLITPNAVEKEILNVYKIKSPGLLKELLHYYPDGNFDRISALIQLMWLKQEYYKKIQNPTKKGAINVNTDKFWDRPFKKRVTQSIFEKV